MQTARNTVAACLTILSLVGFAGASKFVASGWEFGGESGRVEALLARADDMDKTPIDGCVLYLVATGRDGTAINGADIVHQPAWDNVDLEPLVPKYRQLLAHKAFRHSFLNFYHAPRQRIAWTNDVGWSRIAHDMRIAARFAKACGFVGLHMDPEDYHHQNQFLFMDTDGASYEEAAACVRRRSREIFAGVFGEFPDARLFSYWFLSMGNKDASNTDGRHLRDMMYRGGEDLWPHFVEGIFDALPQSAVLIDGIETAYNWRASRMQYMKAANNVRQGLVNLLAPENQFKYRAQMQNSFGFYLDGYSIITNGQWYMESVNGSRLEHMRLNLKQATAAADDFIWLWGERGSWIEGVKGLKAWNTLMPGLHETLLLAKSPAELGRHLRMRMEKGELKNLNPNPACLSENASTVPKPYGSWQEPSLRSGTLGTDLAYGHGDSSSLVAEGVQKGSFSVGALNRRQGEVFGLSFCFKGRYLSASVVWRRDNRWDWSMPAAAIPVSSAADADGWTRTDWSITIPDGAEGFSLMFNVRLVAGEKCWLDDILVIPAGI